MDKYIAEYGLFSSGFLKDISVDIKEVQTNMLLAAFGMNRILITFSFPYCCSEEHTVKRVLVYSAVPVKKPGHLNHRRELETYFTLSVSQLHAIQDRLLIESLKVKMRKHD